MTGVAELQNQGRVRCTKCQYEIKVVAVDDAHVRDKGRGEMEYLISSMNGGDRGVGMSDNSSAADDDGNDDGYMDVGVDGDRHVDVDVSVDGNGHVDVDVDGSWMLRTLLES